MTKTARRMLALMDRATTLWHIPVVGRAKGRVIRRVIERHGCTRGLEIGSLFGYSAILIAGAMPPRGRLTCIEANAYLARFAGSNVAIAGLGPRVKAVLSRLYGRKPTALDAPDVPLDILGTAFQWKVWKALTEIPAGETRTYGEIARSIGEPKAARAVGRACATNQAAVVIPCHRAVGSSGALTGYRWGVARKERLLELEKRARR